MTRSIGISSDEECDGKLDKLKLYEDIKEGEINKEYYLTNYINMHRIIKAIFSPIEMSKLKE